MISIRSRHGIRWLGGSVAFLSGLLLLPELSLRSLPDWEEQWQRGIAATEAGDLGAAIAHVSKAVEHSPTDNELLNGMWDYLGGLHLDANDHESAERALHAALRIVESRSSSRHRDHLHAHNQLVRFYWRIEDIENERQHLHRAIEFNRLAHSGDSIQEAGCWKRLAVMERQAGRSDEALRLLDKAIAMLAGLDYPHEWSLNYWKDLRSEWTTSPLP